MESSTSSLAIVEQQVRERLGGTHPEFVALVAEAIHSGAQITIEDVLRVWRAPQLDRIPGLTRNIIWVEEGNDRSGYQHILKHEAEFADLGVPKDKLAELAEAATTVGVPGGKQTKKANGRPIFGLYFYNAPIAVAISVGDNGYVVGMNPSNLQKCIDKAGITVDELKELYSWPALNN